ncbi:MAG: hypothetical protein F4087_02825 [Gemmatimonadetes bacterium]|nr:hypothetical protein [Gemmatimonadota bacterium]MYA12989.1 hypothetical protein [Gemmatimonadota bacterium]MYD12852.1 hypothetical protein [Gemmatimonadota bacterium]MYE69269.1 hypothetical protein [Gemmatimonadota bacterium]MYI64435.1 hypothetical protein [Gemmatimonadota bacterium]
MKESMTPQELRGLRRASIAATIGFALTPVAGVAALVSAFIDPERGWSMGLFFIAVGPSMYAFTVSPLVAGPRSLALLRLLHSVRPLHFVLLIAVIATSVYDGMHGLMPWWWVGTSVVACGCMLMALKQLSAPGPAGQP